MSHCGFVPIARPLHMHAPALSAVFRHARLGTRALIAVALVGALLTTLACDTRDFDILLGPPVVSGTTPADTSTFNIETKAVVIRFNQPMDATTLIATNVTFVPTITATLTNDSTTMTFTPTTPLAFDTLYTVTVLDAIMNVSGEMLDGDEDGAQGGSFTFTFTTVPDPAGLGVLSGKTWRDDGEVSNPAQGNVTKTFAFFDDSATAHAEILMVQALTASTDPRVVRAQWDETGGITAPVELAPAIPGGNTLEAFQAIAAHTGSTAFAVRLHRLTTSTLEAIVYSGGAWGTWMPIATMQPDISSNPWASFKLYMRGDVPTILWIDANNASANAGDLIMSEFTTGTWSNTTVHDGTFSQPAVEFDARFVDTDHGVISYAVVSGSTANGFLMAYNSGLQAAEQFVIGAQVQLVTPTGNSRNLFLLQDTLGNIVALYIKDTNAKRLLSRRFFPDTNTWGIERTAFTYIDNIRRVIAEPGTADAVLETGLNAIPQGVDVVTTPTVDRVWILAQRDNTDRLVRAHRYNAASDSFTNQTDLNPPTTGPVRTVRLYRDQDNAHHAFILEENAAGTDAQLHRFFYTDANGWSSSTNRLDATNTTITIGGNGSWQFANLIGFGSADGVLGLIEDNNGSDHLFGTTYSRAGDSFIATANQGGATAGIDESQPQVRVDAAGDGAVFWRSDDGVGNTRVIVRNAIAGAFAGTTTTVRTANGGDTLLAYAVLQDFHVDVAGSGYSGSFTLLVLSFVTDNLGIARVFANSLHD